MRENQRNALSLALAEIGRLQDISRKRSKAGFDGLLDRIPKGASPLLRAIITDLEHFLIRKYSDAGARQLLSTVTNGLGVDDAPEWGNVPEADLLALKLLARIQLAIGKAPEVTDSIFLGEFGAQEAKRRQGSSRPRRPHIDDFIFKQLTHDFTLTGPEIWSRAGSRFIDEIGEDRFSRRVGKMKERMRDDASK